MRVSIPFTYKNVRLVRPWGDIIECTHDDGTMPVGARRYIGSRPTVESIAAEELRIAEATRRLARAKAIRAALDAYEVALARELTNDRKVMR